MNYDLAKQLKDAGFPTKQYIGAKYYRFISHPRMGIPAQQSLTTQVADHAIPYDVNETYIPTLSELIEACGSKFNALVNKGGFWLATGGMSSGIYGDEFVIQGPTPEIAVARLWLALRNKLPA